MATIAPGLNFRIGADVKGINKAIREAEKSLRGAVSSFSSIGNSLSLALSAPLAAFGAMAIKTAGDMESLRFALEGTMKDAGRSTAEAAAELEALRKAALAPGLDFEQAVRGSVRLQSVGKSAEEARRILVELANALALSGGSADQLDGVTRQFTQMIGKGKLMQEDLTIILENMPALAKVMNETWGTTNAEKLRDMGVSVEDFLTKLTTGMEKLPRAAGGIANAIVNAQNAIKQALASVGEELNKTFNITQKLNDFSEWVADMAQAFRNLDDGTKRLVVGFTVFAAALGPAFKLMQAGVFVAGKLNVAFLILQRTLAQSMAGQAIPSLITKWKALDFAMKASIIGGIAAVVLAAAAAFYVMSKDMSAAAVAGRALAEVEKIAADAVSEARAKTQYLVDVIKDENAGYKEKQGALKKLNEIAPEYFKGLSIEKSSIDDLNKAYDGYINSILRAARAKAAEEKLIELDKESIALAEKKNRLTAQSTREMVGATNGMGSMTAIEMQAARTKKELIARTDEQIAANKAAMDTLKETIKVNTDFSVGQDVVKTKTKDLTDETKKAKTELEKYLETVKKNADAQKQWNDAREAMGISGLEQVAQKAPALEQADMSQSFSSIFAGFDALDMATANVEAFGTTAMTALTPAQALIKSLTNETLSFGEAFDIVAASMAENGSVFQQIGFGVVDAISGLADAGAGLEEMAGGIVKVLKKIIGGLIKTGVTAVVTKALLASALNPFAALALGAASGALAQGLFNTLLNKVKIPELADGGVLHSPRLVMAGEYPGASTNPEIVTPENKMRDVVGEMLQKFGGTGGGNLTCVVRGDDLLFVLEKAQVKSARKR